MTSKQRAYLRGLANTMEPIIHVGKDGVNENMIRQTSDALTARGGLMDAYRARSATLGQRVQVIAPAGSFTGTALAVTDSGSLIVEDEEGQHREVLAADVSVRGIMGYA